MGLRAVGLDLAWSDGHGTGACVLDEAGVMLADGILGGDDEVVGWVERWAGSVPAVVAVDAPLQVPNPTGRRPCEAEVTATYGGRHAGTHPSNRTLFLRRFGRIRGEDLAARFSRLGFGGPWEEGERTVLEVYPHPGLIEVFGLDERLAYKKKRRRVAAWREGLATLAGLLATLADADPPLVAPPMRIDETVRGRALKDAEDRLDARFCAWTALLWARRGPAAFHLFGDPATGHIAVPRAPGRETPEGRFPAQGRETP